jgi:hypothetical protein
MTERLFDKYPWHGVWAATIKAAVADVNQLPRKAFSDPALGGMLQKIAEKHSVEIATLDTANITAKPRVEERDGQDSWGDRRRFTMKWLDVTIPFNGEAETLRTHPSSWSTPAHGAQISSKSLTISIPDDANVEATVKKFCEVTNGVLNTLRSEYQRDKPQLEQAISKAVEHRKAEIAAEAERDSKLSFKVHR